MSANSFQAWTTRLKESRARAGTLAGDLSDEQLNWKENAERWSIGECLEHMVVGVEEYLAPLRPKLESATARISPEEFQPRHTFMGRQIVKAVSPRTTSAMKSPKIFLPTSSAVSGDILDRFLRAHEELSSLIASAEGLDTNRIRMSSPVAWFIRINATDAFEILVAHAERHLNQAERVRNADGFPQ